jgi:plastocyanin
MDAAVCGVLGSMRRTLLALAGVGGLATAVVPALAADQSVKVEDYRFAPAAIAVKPGDTVTISRDGTAYAMHDVHWADRTAAELAPTTADFTVTRTFTAADDNQSFVFFCDVHRSVGMTATVYVNDAGTVPAAPPPTTTGPSSGYPTTPAPSTTTPAPSTTTGAPSNGGAPVSAPRLRAAILRASARRGLIVRVTLDSAARVSAVVRRGRARARTIAFSARRGTTRHVLLRHPRRGRYALTLRARDASGPRSTPVRLHANVHR